MKKVLTLCLTLLLVITLALPVMAAPGAFVSSPSAAGAPALDSFKADTEGCTAEIVITAYADRANLDEASRQELEEAYNQIVNSGADNAFAKALAQLAASLNMQVSGLSISHLFDIDTTDCATHDSHGGFTITLKIENADKLLGVLRMGHTAQWELCDSVVVDKEAGTVTFHAADFSPFALVVDNGTTSGPQIVDDEKGGAWWIILIVVVVLIAVAVVVFLLLKKKKDEEALANAVEAAAEEGEAQTDAEETAEETQTENE
jgi:flagellar basal body-associated protein FliL